MGTCHCIETKTTGNLLDEEDLSKSMKISQKIEKGKKRKNLFFLKKVEF